MIAVHEQQLDVALKRAGRIRGRHHQ